MFQPPSVTVTAFGNRLHKFIPAGEQKDPHSGSLKRVINKKLRAFSSLLEKVIHIGQLIFYFILASKTRYTGLFARLPV